VTNTDNMFLLTRIVPVIANKIRWHFYDKAIVDIYWIVLSFLDGLHKVHLAYRMENAGQVTSYWAPLCVINSSHAFMLTLFKLSIVVIDILKMCMLLFQVFGYFSKKNCMHLNFKSIVELSYFYAPDIKNCEVYHFCPSYHSVDDILSLTKNFNFGYIFNGIYGEFDISCEWVFLVTDLSVDT
jgi:hypothetical protein